MHFAQLRQLICRTKTSFFFIAAVNIGWKMLSSLVIYWDGNKTHPVYYGVWVDFDLLSVESHNPMLFLILWLIFRWEIVTKYLFGLKHLFLIIRYDIEIELKLVK